MRTTRASRLARRASAALACSISCRSCSRESAGLGDGASLGGGLRVGAERAAPGARTASERWVPETEVLNDLVGADSSERPRARAPRTRRPVVFELEGTPGAVLVLQNPLGERYVVCQGATPGWECVQSVPESLYRADLYLSPLEGPFAVDGRADLRGDRSFKVDFYDAEAPRTAMRVVGIGGLVASALAGLVALALHETDNLDVDVVTVGAPVGAGVVTFGLVTALAPPDYATLTEADVSR